MDTYLLQSSCIRYWLCVRLIVFGLSKVSVMNKVNIYGGLGNQMFQYAFVHMLKSNGLSTRISIRDFFLYNHHNGFELTRAFDINLNYSDRFKLKLLEAGSFLWGYSVIKRILAISFSLYSKLFEDFFSYFFLCKVM